MKKLKALFAQVKDAAPGNPDEMTRLLLQLICYSPKFPLRLNQQQLLDEAASCVLQADDPHFSHTKLNFNGFIWGNGSRKILITHGWGSKAADFAELITSLRTIDNVQIIAFDAPGNGSSEGELSNLLLFVRAAEAVIKTYGEPDVMIGHSLGGMANAMAIQNLALKPRLQVSIAPLVRLKENFIATMTQAGASEQAQERFFDHFEKIFNTRASYFRLTDLYNNNAEIRHWLAYDSEDKIAPYVYLQEFLTAYPSVTAQEYPGATHERILKEPGVISTITELIKHTLSN